MKSSPRMETDFISPLMDKKILKELLGLLSDEELIRLERRADLNQKLTLSTLLRIENIKRDEQTDVKEP